ncbi:hypothetical protein CBR_g37044 [Chara braunii]|uniref:DUF4360 domain-containing protein n=1 Tax=Chara braunii TaxID=69332 RepID=A0A388LM40_CHABU|nr:hypothetical protein CBR_g37044 [Chara braunii]|eukprot:GBG83331.1 hypothetical protein CBR_g37044 [Chara braunii]
MAVMVALSIVTILSVATPAFAGPPKVEISLVVWGGTGCSYSDSSAALPPPYDVLTVLFGNMIATTDKGLPDTRKFCQFSFSLTYPKGWSFTLGTVTGRGFRDVAAGSTGFYETQFYFSGQQGTPTITRTLPGPQKGNFEFTDVFFTEVYSKCNDVPNLNIKHVVRVEGAKALVGLDSSDSKFELLFAFKWKKC